MIKIFPLLILLFVSGCTQQSMSIFMQDLDKEAETISTWVEENSAIKAPASKRPGVYVTSKKEMAYIRGHNKARAFYRVLTNSIVFQDSWSRDNPVDVGVAIHEYVHFMQLKTRPRLKFKCTAEREKEPYRLQLLYYKNVGYKHGYTPEQIRKLTACVGDGNGE